MDAGNESINVASLERTLALKKKKTLNICLALKSFLLPWNIFLWIFIFLKSIAVEQWKVR